MQAWLFICTVRLCLVRLVSEMCIYFLTFLKCFFLIQKMRLLTFLQLLNMFSQTLLIRYMYCNISVCMIYLAISVPTVRGEIIYKRRKTTVDAGENFCTPDWSANVRTEIPITKSEHCSCKSYQRQTILELCFLCSQ